MYGGGTGRERAVGTAGMGLEEHAEDPPLQKGRSLNDFFTPRRFFLLSSSLTVKAPPNPPLKGKKTFFNLTPEPTNCSIVIRFNYTLFSLNIKEKSYKTFQYPFCNPNRDKVSSLCNCKIWSSVDDLV